MKVKFIYPIEEMNGLAGGESGLVFFKSRGLNVCRSNFQPNNPQTDEQVAIRGYQTASSNAFQSLSAAEKAAWNTYAELMTRRIMGQEYINPAISEYCSINNLRQIGGQAITDVAPTAKCDFGVTGVSTVSYEAGELLLTITHTATVLTNKLLLIKTTESMPSPVRVPQPSDFRLVEGMSGDSITALLTSGNEYTFDNPIRATWANGDTIGLIITPLSADYVPGTPYQTTAVISVP